MTAPPPSRHPLSRSRKTLFLAIVALLCLALLELGSALVLRSMRGEWTTYRGLLGEDDVATATAPDETGEKSEEDDPDQALRADVHAPRWILHPFLGFGRNPEAPRQGLRGRLIRGLQVNEHGFFGPSPVTRPKKRFNVLLTGGSVALELYLDARGTLIDLLSKLPAARDREVVLVCGALGGMKQPQQLLALNYFLALGASYDLVLNLDGFNEITLPIAENLNKGVYPFYPRNWAEYAATSVDLPRAAIYGRLSELNARQAARRERLAASPLRFSFLRATLWEIGNRRLGREILALEEDLQRRTAETALTPQQRGPAYPEQGRLATTRDLVRVWSRSSRQMDALADRQGFVYLHFLQPNQYVEASKPFTEVELYYAINVSSVYAAHAIRGYPLLIEEGRELTAAGVTFHDLTGIFENEPETLYDDSCCHLNKVGYDLLARAIGARVARDERLLAP